LVVRWWLFPFLPGAAAGVNDFVRGYMLTDTEHDGRTTVLLSLLVAALVLAVAVVRQRVGTARAAAGKD
ncbi:amino acid transporter, partial [Streptomyces olivaceus]